MGCHFLLQGIPKPGSEPEFLSFLLPFEPLGKPSDGKESTCNEGLFKKKKKGIDFIRNVVGWGRGGLRGHLFHSPGQQTSPGCLKEITLQQSA